MDVTNKEGQTVLDIASSDMLSFVKQCQRKVELKKIKLTQDVEDLKKENEKLKSELNKFLDAFATFQLRAHKDLDALKSDNKKLQEEVSKLRGSSGV